MHHVQKMSFKTRLKSWNTEPLSLETLKSWTIETWKCCILKYYSPVQNCLCLFARRVLPYRKQNWKWKRIKVFLKIDFEQQTEWAKDTQIHWEPSLLKNNFFPFLFIVRRLTGKLCRKGILASDVNDVVCMQGIILVHNICVQKKHIRQA